MVDGQPVTLSTIAALIAEQPTFADHLATRAYENDGAPVRLIPVSVTGPFAAYDEAQDNVVKVPGHPVVPCNVEIPFYAILPDALQWELDRLAEAPRGPTGDRAIRRLSHNAELLARARALTETAAAPLTTWLARRIAARRAA